MATYTSIVDPGNAQTASGGDWDTDYTSLNAWEIAQDGVSRSSGDIVIADCRRSTSAKDETSITIYQFPTGVKPQIIVHDDYRNEDATWKDQRDDGNYVYTLSTGAADNIRLAHNDILIDGLQINPTSDKTGVITAAAIESVVVKNTIIKVATGSSGVGIRVAHAGASIVIENCIVFGYSGSTLGYGFGITANGTLTVYNSVAYDCRYCLARTSGTLLAMNTIALNYTVGAATGLDASSDHLYTDASSITGSNSLTNQSDPFEDAANGDFRIKSDSNAIDAGIGPSSDSDVPQYDIDGTERTGSSCDIGAWEYVSATPSIVPTNYYFTLMQGGL